MKKQLPTHQRYQRDIWKIYSKAALPFGKRVLQTHAYDMLSTLLHDEIKIGGNIKFWTESHEINSYKVQCDLDVQCLYHLVHWGQLSESYLPEKFSCDIWPIVLSDEEITFEEAIEEFKRLQCTPIDVQTFFCLLEQHAKKDLHGAFRHAEDWQLVPVAISWCEGGLGTWSLSFKISNNYVSLKLLKDGIFPAGCVFPVIYAARLKK